MHDLATLESLDVPSVMVASAEFKDAALAQAKALGTRPASVFVPHPIQDRSDAEMTRMADAALDAVIAGLMRDAK